MIWVYQQIQSGVCQREEVNHVQNFLVSEKTSTPSKAEARTKGGRILRVLESENKRMGLVTLTRAVSGLCSERKPHWKSSKRGFCSKVILELSGYHLF